MSDLNDNKTLLKLKKKLETLEDKELYEYVLYNYKQKSLCCKKNLLIRYILNIERNRLNLKEK